MSATRCGQPARRQSTGGTHSGFAGTHSGFAGMSATASPARDKPSSTGKRSCIPAFLPRFFRCFARAPEDACFFLPDAMLEV
jgi:hypothetical protein